LEIDVEIKVADSSQYSSILLSQSSFQTEQIHSLIIASGCIKIEWIVGIINDIYSIVRILKSLDC